MADSTDLSDQTQKSEQQAAEALESSISSNPGEKKTTVFCWEKMETLNSVLLIWEFWLEYSHVVEWRDTWYMGLNICTEALVWQDHLLQSNKEGHSEAEWGRGAAWTIPSLSLFRSWLKGVSAKPNLKPHRGSGACSDPGSVAGACPSGSHDDFVFCRMEAPLLSCLDWGLLRQEGAPSCLGSFSLKRDGPRWRVVVDSQPKIPSHK